MQPRADFAPALRPCVKALPGMRRRVEFDRRCVVENRKPGFVNRDARRRSYLTQPSLNAKPVYGVDDLNIGGQYIGLRQGEATGVIALRRQIYDGRVRRQRNDIIEPIKGDTLVGAGNGRASPTDRNDARGLSSQAGHQVSSDESGGAKDYEGFRHGPELSPNRRWSTRAARGRER